MIHGAANQVQLVRVDHENMGTTATNGRDQITPHDISTNVAAVCIVISCAMGTSSTAGLLHAHIKYMVLYSRVINDGI